MKKEFEKWYERYGYRFPWRKNSPDYITPDIAKQIAWRTWKRAYKVGWQEGYHAGNETIE